MKYHTIAHSDLDVSTLCLGTMNMGQQNSEAQGHDQLDYAIGTGINFIDTAEIYPIPPDPEKQGTTERYVGSWLKKSGKRSGVILATKVTRSPIIRTRPQDETYSRENIRTALEGSLERLGTDYVDLYQIHWPGRETNFFGTRGYTGDENEANGHIEETLTTLTELIKEGKIRYVGISNETPWGVAEYLRLHREKGLARIVTIQNQYSLLNRTFEIGLSEFAMREGVELLAYSPLDKGVLTGKYLGGARPPGARYTLWDRDTHRYNAEHSQPAIAAYVDLAKRHGLTPAQLALAFVNTRKFLAATIIGARTMEQLQEAISSIEVELSPEVLEEINDLYTRMPDPHA